MTLSKALPKRPMNKSLSLNLLPHETTGWHGFPLIVTIFLLISTLTNTSFAEAPSLKVGTFKAEVTLPLGHPCYPSYQPLETTEFPLFAKGVVLVDGDDRYVLCAFDWCEICNSAHDLIREKIAGAVETSPERVAVQCVHQHTAPMAVLDAQRILDQTEGTPLAFEEEVMFALFDQVAGAAGKAMDDLQSCDRLGTSEVKVEKVASSRRIPNGDGTITGRMSSCTNPDIRALPEGLIDPMLKTITFAQGDTPIVRLHYYATHPQSFYGDPRQGYDFVGIARERQEKQEGVFQIYFTGCAGDVACGKYNDRTPEARDRLTERLFAALSAVPDATEYQPVGPIRWRTHGLKAPARSYNVEELRKQIADPSLTDLRRIMPAQTLAFIERKDKPFLLSSLQINDVYLIHLPGEPCIEFQLYAQQLRPEGFVAVAGYADGGCGYICTEKMFPEGGYEPSASKFVPEAEKPTREAIQSLMGK